MINFTQKIVFILLIIILSGCSTSKVTPKSKTIDETIPITMANIRGHKSLYNRGWFIISSSKDALKFAQEHSIDNAKDALSTAIQSINDNTKIYSDSISKNVEDGLQTTQSTYNKGSQNTKNILNTTDALTTIQADYSKELFEDAWGSLIKGNISLLERTQEESKQLANIGKNYFKNLKSDFSNLQDIASSITFFANKEISLHWENAFRDAKKSFIESYNTSGESDSSLGALFHIMQGYLKAIYYAAIKPTAKTLKTTAEGTYSTGKDIAKLAFIPVGTSISIVGRGVQSLGLSLYYTSSIGIKIVSPTIEAGFLSGLGILSLSSTGLTYIGGKSLGVVNQIGTTFISPVAGAGTTLINTAYDTTKLVTFIGYDVLEGTTEIFINEAASGVVLGYNALLAIPTHTLLAASDGVFFLAWDGPRLVLAMAKGEIKNININKLPVGTVVDLQKLKTQKNIKVKIISQDYKLLEKILHRLPVDMETK